ncbi:MAG: hypothetical protein Kow0069_16450 [Promethearchaeota archaeon]
MPGMAHVVLSLGLGVFLQRVTANGGEGGSKFTAKHTMILAVNSIFGPDLVGAPFPWTSPAYWFVHMSYGWLLVAVPLAFLWHLLTERVAWKGIRPTLVEEGRKPHAHLTLGQVYCLVAAGGLLHMFVDVIGHPSYLTFQGSANTPWGAIWFFGPNAWLSILDIWGTGLFPCGNTLGFWQTWLFTYLVVGGILFGGLLWWAYKSEKRMERFTVFAFLLYVIPLAIAYAVPANLGQVLAQFPAAIYMGPTQGAGQVPLNYFGSAFYLVGGEADFGVMVFFLGFFFLPLAFIYYSFKPRPGAGDVKAWALETFDLRDMGGVLKEKAVALGNMVNSKLVAPLRRKVAESKAKPKKPKEPKAPKAPKEKEPRKLKEPKPEPKPAAKPAPKPEPKPEEVPDAELPPDEAIDTPEEVSIQEAFQKVLSEAGAIKTKGDLVKAVKELLPDAPDAEVNKVFTLLKNEGKISYSRSTPTGYSWSG